jgi:corrinoid protein of di/trimethylamine methyltransferase
MVSKEDQLFEDIKSGLIKLDAEKVKLAIDAGLKQDLDPMRIQEQGLRKGLEHIGDLFESGEVFIPHLMFGAKIFNAGMEILEPHLKKSRPSKSLATAVIGTVFGDLHDLGKNLVSLMWSISGFSIVDLGTNVSVDTFLKAIDENNPKILGLSSLLTTTMLQQQKVIEALAAANVRKGIKVMVGGAPVTETWANEIGADAYAKDAADALAKAKKLVNAK